MGVAAGAAIVVVPPAWGPADSDPLPAGGALLPTSQPALADQAPGDAVAPIGASAAAPPRTGDVESASIAGLNAIADADRQPVTSELNDKWVPQLSVKWRGQQWRGVTYADPSILTDHLNMRLSFANVRLLRASEWTTLTDSDHPESWITVAGSVFADATGANGWCDTNKLGPDDCFARLISTANPPPVPNYVNRR